MVLEWIRYIGPIFGKESKYYLCTDKPIMQILRPIFILLAMLLIAGCGGGSSEPIADDAPVVFHFRMRGQPLDQDFRAVISNQEVKARARAQLALPESQRTLHVVGSIGRTNGGYNFNWSWHFEGTVNLTEISIELCDTGPALIEENVEYWLTAPGGACPWGSYVYAEIF